jgi:hypothetical protein
MPQPSPLPLRLVVNNPRPIERRSSRLSHRSTTLSGDSSQPETPSLLNLRLTLLMQRLAVLDALNPSTVAGLGVVVEGLIGDEIRAHQRDAVASDE